MGRYSKIGGNIASSISYYMSPRLEDRPSDPRCVDMWNKLHISAHQRVPTQCRCCNKEKPQNVGCGTASFVTSYNVFGSNLDTVCKSGDGIYAMSIYPA